MSVSQSLRREPAVFQRSPERAPSFASPRPRAQGVFDGKHLRIAGDDGAVDLSGHDYLAFGAAPQIKQIMMESLARHDAAIPGSAAFAPEEAARALGRALVRYHFGARPGTRASAATATTTAPGTGTCEDECEDECEDDGVTLTFTAAAGSHVTLLEALGLHLQTHVVPQPAPPPSSPPGSPQATAPGAPVRFPDNSGAHALATPVSLFIDGDLSFSARHAVRLAHKLAPGRCQALAYRAGDLQHLAELLAADCEQNGDRALRMIVSDAVDPATGKLFDLASLCHLAEEYDCLLFVDESHGVGVHGPLGRGVTAELSAFARYRDRLILMGTLTKAFCQRGGYVTMRAAAVARLQRLLGRQHLPSAPLAPWMASALVDVVALVSGEFGDKRRERLRAITRRTGELLRAAHFELIGTPHSPILAMPLREVSLATAVLEELQQSGFLVSVFQGPRMPAGGEVIRLALRADLEPDDIDRLVAALVRCRDRHRPAFGLATPMRLPAARR